GPLGAVPSGDQHPIASPRATRLGLSGAAWTFHPHPGVAMLLIREIMYCKPGKVRPLVEKFTAMSKLGESMGMPKMKAMTDLSAEAYWTVGAEMEVKSMDSFEAMMSGQGQKAEDMKKFEELMKGYHDLVDSGRREIYKLEG